LNPRSCCGATLRHSRHTEDAGQRSFYFSRREVRNRFAVLQRFEFFVGQHRLSQDAPKCADGDFSMFGYYGGYYAFWRELHELFMTSLSRSFFKAGCFEFASDYTVRHWSKRQLPVRSWQLEARNAVQWPRRGYPAPHLWFCLGWRSRTPCTGQRTNLPLAILLL
jgi:hypothetical protein